MSDEPLIDHYYTLEEGARYLGCSPDELAYFISKESLDCVIECKEMPFFIVNPLQEKKKLTLGRGTCRYHGLIQPCTRHPIVELLERKNSATDKTVTAYGDFKLLEPENITSWATDEPFTDVEICLFSVTFSARLVLTNSAVLLRRVPHTPTRSGYCKF